MARQEVLRRKEPPWVVVLLTETAIRTLVGNREITKAQLNRLLELRQEPNVSILIAPANSPVYPASGFTLLTRNDNPNLGYVEGAGGNELVIELSSKVEQLRRLWDMISKVCSDRHGLGGSDPRGDGGLVNDGKRAIWRKSSHSTQEGGQCVELANLGTALGVRDSTDPAGSVLQFGRDAVAGLLDQLKTGELDR